VTRIGVLTGGGDAPGMNAAIRAVVRKAVFEGLSVVGVQRGYAGLIEGDFRPLDPRSVADIIHRGGTILQTARSEEFRTPEGFAAACSRLREAGIDGLVAIGGGGTFRGALALAGAGFAVVGVPGSIDNDIPGTEYSIGFDTAVDTALDAIERLRDTAFAHSRVFLVEVMGRDTGFIALAAALAGGAEFVLVPEIAFDLGALCEGIKTSYARGKRHSIVVVAEGAASAMELGQKVREATGLDTRVTVLGHVQRGGRPTGFDRTLASHMGAAAVDHLLQGPTGQMMAWRCGRVAPVPLAEVVAQRKEIDRTLYDLARILAI
jgi:6-phosphofructokinase 1